MPFSRTYKGDGQGRISLLRGLVLLLFLGGVLAVALGFTRFGLYGGVGIGMLPLLFLLLYASIREPGWGMVLLFVGNYFIMGIGRIYHWLPVGMLLDALLGFNLVVVFFRSMSGTVPWKQAWNGLTCVALLWLVYCLIEAFNPFGNRQAWFSSIRSFALYFLEVTVLVQVTMGKFKWVKRLMVVWVVLTLLAVGKALYQKYVGFTPVEKFWLYVLEGARTHIIYSGIRYFSFFSDAANFSGSMGLSMVVFSIAALYYRNPWMKLLLLFTAAAACYGLLLSGTRSALAVPFAGYTLYVLLSCNVKRIIYFSLSLIAVFCFLKFTTIGNSYALIRRTRSAFSPTEDASFKVRLDNQAKLRELMWSKPFGTGLGMGGGKAKRYAPDAPLSQIATDSWLVQLWVETGMVGIGLYLLLLGSVFAYGAWLVLFRIRDNLVKGITTALICGVAGLLVMSYANEIFAQIPNGVIVYMSLTFIFMAQRFDRELAGEGEPDAAPLRPTVKPR